ncbi:SusC/RagA family TonB-linked outer membrane protein [Chitinophaga sp. XS-30]|uniref:SusC/RagA family TonB-linked outer membrane protein n=1 Tax=Chitinophaga sp. XS-30 TaxID=2604421 RepID=UPI0011DDAEB4|nr:SusC/RagA family TonB-linked outer membrane protein [Chitinophaga sp. XS-30]QEH42668.1 SusC/RagA family TonB-linked outer membrane protein [Chitinophaga sp. XS-30]
MQKKRIGGLIPLKMSLAVMLCCSLLLCCSPYILAQDAGKRISVDYKNTPLEEVCNELEKKTGFYFSYPENVLSAYGKKITLSMNNVTLPAVLDQLFRNSSLNYVIRDKMIYLSGKAAEQNAAGQHTLTGTVTDEESGDPVIGASIRVGNTGGTQTDANGRFALRTPPGKYNIVISSIGYITKYLPAAVPVNGTAALTVKMVADKSKLNEVVVTALGISREKKKLGYAMQEIKGEDISMSKSANMLSGLLGKVAGLNMTQASTGIANSVRVVLRGESSLNINKNQALVVVDGIPINNNAGTAASNDLPVDYGSGGAEINPDDIASITILKGPNAAALYGSRAASGALIIKTKKASDSKKLGISFRSTAVFDKVLKLPDFQNEYGGGTGVGLDYYSYGDGPDGPNTSNSGHNWGAPFEGQEFVQYGSPRDEQGNRIRIPWVARPDNVKDFYETGQSFSNTISLHKTGDIGGFRASYGNFNQKGIMPNTELHRHQFNVNSTVNISPRLTFNSNINYINSYSDNLPVVGYGSGSPTYNFIWFERNADINWFRNYWVKGQEGTKQDYYFTWGDNPYMTMYEQLNNFKRNRLFGNAYLNYAITDRLSLMMRTGIDYSGDIRMSRRPIGSVVAINGLVRRQDYTYFERNSDFLLSYEGDTFLKDFKWNASFGGNNMQINTFNNTTTANGLVVPNVYNLGNASSRPAISETNTLKSVNSLYMVADLDFRNQVFLQVTGRNDWSSTLPASNRSYFYPSVSLSAIASDILKLNNNWLDFWKLRTSYASVGNDTDPYQTSAYYEYSTLPGNVTLPSTLPNADLKPEITTSFEIGTDLKLFHNRLGIEVTYYATESRNQILRSPLAISSGYSAQVMNAGKITNKGVELALQVTPVKRALTWDVMLTASTNRSKVVELTEGVNSYILATAQNATVEARVGGEMGDIYGVGFLRNEEGKIVYRNGVPVFSSQTMKIGNYNPDLIAGIRNSFRYKAFNFSFLFDGRFGGTIYSYSHSAGSEAGSLTNTLPGRKEGIVGDGVVLQTDGKWAPNTQNVAAYTYYRAYYKRPNVEANSFDATFFKLREVVAGYALPAKLLARGPFQSAQFSLTGRNLLLFAKAPGIDPETAFVTGGTILPGIENAQIPSTRSFGADLKLTF